MKSNRKFRDAFDGECVTNASPMRHEVVAEAEKASKLNGLKQAMPVDVLLYWVYGRQLADKARYSYQHLAPADGALDSCLRLVKIGELGMRADGGGGGVQRVHPDAEAVDEAVQRLFDRAQQGLIVHYGRCGGVPDWLPGALAKYRPVKNSAGKVKKIYAGNRKEPIGCVVDVECSIERIAYHRRMYALWWACIARLAWELQKSDVLVSVSVGYPNCPAEPWKC